MGIDQIDPVRIRSILDSSQTEGVEQNEGQTGQRAEVIDIAEFLTRFPTLAGRPNPLYSAAPGLARAHGQRDQGMRLAFEVEQRFLEMVESNPDMFKNFFRGLS